MKKTILLIAIFILLPTYLIQRPAYAISNIESERPNLPNQGFSGTVKLSLDGKTGNQKEATDEGAVKLIYRQDSEIFLGIVAKDYATNHSVKTTDSSFLHTRWVHLLNDSWATETFAQWEKDEFDNLTYRALVGGGGRYIVSQQKDVYSFAVGLGAFHETEKQNLITYQETNHVWRMNSYYAYKYQINDQLLFANTFYYQPNISDWGDCRMLFETGLTINMAKRLQLKLTHKIAYDSQPVNNPFSNPPIHNYKTNTEYKTALIYNF